MTWALATSGVWVLLGYRLLRSRIIAWLTPEHRAWLARKAAAACVVGWPLSQATIAREEPPFVLGLSWLAILVTALDLAATTDVRKQQN